MNMYLYYHFSSLVEWRYDEYSHVVVLSQPDIGSMTITAEHVGDTGSVVVSEDAVGVKIDVREAIRLDQFGNKPGRSVGRIT